MNILEYDVFCEFNDLNDHLSCFPGKYLRVEPLGEERCIFNLVRYGQTIFQSGYMILHSTINV